MIDVEHESIEELRGDWGPEVAAIQENCWFCKEPTRYWANGGEVPVCQSCAAVRDPAEVPTREQYFKMWKKK